MSEKPSGKQLARRIATVVIIAGVVLGTFFASSAISSRVRDVNAAKDQVRSDLLEAVNAIETASKNSSAFLLVPAAADFSAEQRQALVTSTSTVLVEVKNNRALDAIYLTRGKQPQVLGDGSQGKSSGYQITAVGIAEPIENWSYTYNSTTKAYVDGMLEPNELASGMINTQAARLSVVQKQLSGTTTLTAEVTGLLAPGKKVAFPESNLNGLAYGRYLSRGGKLTSFDLPASAVSFSDASGDPVDLPEGLSWNLTFVTLSAPQQSRVQLLAQTSKQISPETLQLLGGSTAKVSAPGFSARMSFPLGANVIDVRS